jgi:hypothetical protein
MFPARTGSLLISTELSRQYLKRNKEQAKVEVKAEVYDKTKALGKCKQQHSVVRSQIVESSLNHFGQF